MPPATDNRIIRVGARQLVETVHQTGGLSLLTYHQLSARTGTRTHQAFAALLQAEYLSYTSTREYSLKTIWLEPDLAESSLIQGLEINGRADVLLTPVNDTRVVTFSNFATEPESSFILEVKTVAGPLEFVPPDGEEIHWLQAKLYSYMYWSAQAEADIPREISYALAYVSAETLEADFKFRVTDYTELKQWFQNTCLAYLTRARTIAARLESRDDSIRRLHFPYPALREGQAELIRRVYDSVGRMTPLIAQAPTGTGKTMSTLYPAIKHLPDSDYEYIFYLTAKTSTRRVAEQALKDMREQSGLALRSLTLQAKESMCLNPEIYCDTALCPYATRYYDNLPSALEALAPIDELNGPLFMAAGETHQVCPFELSLDMALLSDVIIGDYNHAFDPRIQLERFFSGSTASHILLIDEAHNLVDRSREMYSATLDSGDFGQLLSLYPSENLYGARLTEPIHRYFNRLLSAMEEDTDGWDSLESPAEGETMRILRQENFRAMNIPLRGLADLLIPWIQHMREQIDSFQDPRQRRWLIELIAKVKFFLRVTDEYWSPAYIACARLNKGTVAIRLICLDISEKLSELYVDRHAAVFFSATLSPMSYFSTNFCGRKLDNRPDTLELPSPFPPENLRVFTADFIQTTYAQRQRSAEDLAKAIALTILLKRGQQFVYFPSYAYMDLIMPLLRKLLSGQEIEWQVQKRHMNLKDRRQFLEAFEHPEKGACVIGFLVLGGIFGEGIDLVGDKLTGVSIVGVGLPQLSPERNIMREYYDEVYGGGFLHAYLYPGITKVLQAAGRLIRSETDEGFLLLLDARYGTPAYRELFPADWQPEAVHNLKELKALLAADRNPEKK